MPAVELTGVTKRFGTVVAAKDISLSVDEGQALCLFGPSGCGKTTLLRLVAGLERPDAGTVRLHNRVVSGNGLFVAPAARGVGMVFQDFALWPHMRVARHLDFVLKAQRVGRAERHARIERMLALVRLEDKRRAFPHELSGGQQQRLGFARALAPRPRVLLLDEPFSNLDAELRTRLREELLRLKAEEQVTLLFATHDRDDAALLADETLEL
jgi:iron(III) transport system ATP-binding protein